jgi:protein tyrosine phosphatase (PTP) superfamily phosphohydrolase (DUF442 family)
MKERRNPYVVIVRQKMSLAEKALLVFCVSAGACCFVYGLIKLGWLK